MSAAAQRRSRGAPWKLAGIAVLVIVLGDRESIRSAAKAWPDGPGSSAGDAEVALGEIEQLLRERSLGAALTAARHLLEAAQQGDPTTAVRARALLAQALSDQGRFDEAIVESEAALEAAALLGEGGLVARLWIERGLTEWKRSEYARAGELCARGAQGARASGDRAALRLAEVCRGRIAFKRGEYLAARQAFSAAIEIAQRSADRRGEAAALTDLAFVDLDQRRLASARAQFEKARALFAALGAARDERRSAKDIAVLHLFANQPERALNEAASLLALAAADGDSWLVAELCRVRAKALARLARTEEAQAEVRRAADLYRLVGDPRNQAWAIADSAELLVGSGRTEQARAAYREALEIWRRLDDRRALAWHLIELARLELEAGEAARALADFRLATGVAESIALPYLSEALGGEAQALLALGDADGARAAATRAVAAARTSDNPEMLWSALFLKGRILTALGERAQALASLLEALEVIEGLRVDAVPTDEAKRAALEDKQEVFAETAELLIALGRPASALEIAERGRARALLDLMARPEPGAALETADAPATEPPPRPPPHERPDGDRARGGEERPPGPPSERLEVASPRAESAPPIAAILAELARRRSWAIEYLVARDRLLIWTVSPQGEVAAVTSPIGAAELEREILELRRALRTDGTSRQSPEPVAFEEGSDAAMPALARLHALLLAPVLARLPAGGEQPIAIVPHGPLFLVPFAALVDRERRYFIEGHLPYLLPSLAALLVGRTEPAPTGSAERALVVGNPAGARDSGGRLLPPLPGAEAEARAVARLLSARGVTTLLAAEASEPRVRELAAGRRVFHLATHGVLRADDPLGSYLALAPQPADASPGGSAAGRDGRWTAREILMLRLPGTELVTLSGCSTGVGPVSGDGVLGLSRAFLAAGAKSVVVSLWRVSDLVTRYEMERFYRAFSAAKGGRARALREAQLATLAELRGARLRTPSGRVLPPDPAHWAPFVLVGDPG